MERLEVRVWMQMLDFCGCNVKRSQWPTANCRGGKRGTLQDWGNVKPFFRIKSG